MLSATRQILGLTQARDVPELWDRFIQAVGQFGFVQVSYGFSRSRHEISLPLSEDDFFLTNLPIEGISRDKAPSLLVRTPMYRWVIENVGACSWSWADEQLACGALTEAEVQAHEAARRAGLSAGYVVSVTDEAACSRGGFSLAAAPGVAQTEVDARWAEVGDHVHALCNVMHLKMRSFPTPSLGRPLSPRQLEALQWVAEGKTTQDIATIMGVSPAMVEKHLRLAREALDVETTAHAVAKAALHNHLFPGRVPSGQRLLRD